MSVPRLLLVEDDAELRNMLRRYLTERDFFVQVLANGNQVDRILERSPYDVLLLDLGLPGEDGLSICRRLRAQGVTIPILMLTARGDPADCIVGLELGADDYLSKPFEPRELIARIGALVRRQVMLQTSPSWASTDNIKFGPFILSMASLELRRNDLPISLTSAELLLLRELVINARKSLSRDHLLTKLRGMGADVSGRSIDIHISRLRRKIEDDPSEPRFLRTIWGVGYMFVGNDGI